MRPRSLRPLLLWILLLGAGAAAAQVSAPRPGPPGPDGKPVFQDGILKKGEMRKDEAQLLIMRARVAAGWIEPETLEQMEADMAAEAAGDAPDLSEEERALMALGEIGKSTGETEELAEEELIFDLDALAAEDAPSEDGDDADPKE